MADFQERLKGLSPENLARMARAVNDEQGSRAGVTPDAEFRRKVATMPEHEFQRLASDLNWQAEQGRLAKVAEQAKRGGNG